MNCSSSIKLNHSDKVVRICQDRWREFGATKQDPCDACPLRLPCVVHAPVGVMTEEKMHKWAAARNDLAETL